MKLKWFLSPWVVVVVLAGCGGGGGSGGAVPPPTVPPPVASLIPAVLPLGAVLATDATELRPLIDQGTWIYRGVQTWINAADSPMVYDNVVTQTSSAPGVATEVASNLDGDGAETQQLLVAGGTVRAPQIVDILDDGRFVRSFDLELRSPVRVNDQQSLLEELIADIGSDLDGDERNEALQVAAYRQVEGSEVLDLPSRWGVTTVRVTTRVLARVVLSRTGEPGPTVEVRLTEWLAPGLGVVKRVSDAPHMDEIRRVSTETLVRFDGVTRGLGAQDPRVLATPGGTKLSGLADVVSFDDHALLMSSAGASGIQGITLSAVDGRGQVLSSYSHTGINAARAQLVRLGSGVAVVAKDDTGIWFHPFDAMGRPTASGPTLLTADLVGDLFGREFRAAGSSAGMLGLFWLAAPNSSTGGSYTLWGRVFNAQGVALAAPFPLAFTELSTSILSPSASASSLGVYFVWGQIDPLTGYGLRYAYAPSPPATPSFGNLGFDTPWNIRPIMTSSQGHLLWSQPDAIGFPKLHGVSLDSRGLPLRATNGPWSAERLPLPADVREAYNLVSAEGDGLAIHLSYTGKLWPDQSLDQTILTVLTFDPAVGVPMATSPGAKLLMRSDAISVPSHMAQLSRVVLLFSTGGGEIVVTPVWRAP